MPAWAVNPEVRISQYGHATWRIQDGSFGGAPYTIAQTVDGYLWIGTANGLVRFDGVRFLPWAPPSDKQLPSPVIARLLAARDGSLWIGTTRGLSQYTKHELINFSSGANAVFDPAAEDERGTIWVLRAGITDETGPLCQVDGPAMHCYAKAEGIPEEPYSSMARDAAGDVWLGGSTSLTRWRPGSFQTYYPGGLKGNTGAPGVCALAAIPDGSLWVGFCGGGPGLGLQRFSRGMWRSFAVPGFDSSRLSVLNLFIDREESLWIGTIGHGVYRIHGREVDHFDSSEGLSGDTIYAFFEDIEGNLWLATDKGLDCFRDLKITTFSTRQGLTAQAVGSVQAMRDGTTWIGGSYGLDILGPGVGQGSLRSVRQGGGLPGTQVTSLFEDHAGQHWVGIDDTLNIYENGRFTRINRRDGSHTGMIFGITEDTSHNLWVSSFGPPRMLMRIFDRRVQEEIPAPQIPGSSSLVADPRGGVWLGLLNGDLARYRGGRLETFRFEHTPDSRVTQMLINSDGSVLGATAFGLIGWSNGKQQTLTSRNGLPCDGVNGIVEDGSGALWLYMQCGLAEIARTDLQTWWAQPGVRLQPTVFDPFDGVQLGNPAPFESKAVRARDGRLWFTNAAVAQVIDPAHLGRSSIAPAVSIEQVTADHESYALEDEVRFPARTRDVEVDYTAPSFSVPQRVRFRYRLDGRDTDWQDAGTRRQAFYTDLRPGTYRFHVIACNGDSIWNESGASLDFSVAPAYYQTAWFRLLGALGAAGAIGSLFLLRLRQATRRLRAQIEARLGERERIARELHDTLLQSVQGLILKFQSVANRIPRDEPARQAIETTLDHADRVVAEGRARVRDLRDGSITLHDLPAALQRVAEEHPGVPATAFRAVVEGSERALHPMVLEESYAIGREALLNALTHSEGGQIEIAIDYGPKQFRLRVRDDGRGIDPAVLEKGGRKDHFGLRGMRERAQKIGAHLELRSKPGSGTEVALTVPAAAAYAARGRAARSWLSRLRKQAS
jgi:signal transduction histidine kinase/ligand-binding sensor domain-containing protein